MQASDVESTRMLTYATAGQLQVGAAEFEALLVLTKEHPVHIPLVEGRH